MNLRQQLIRSLGLQPRQVLDPFNINAALKHRKDNRVAFQAAARSDASKRGWATRKGAKA